MLYTVDTPPIFGYDAQTQQTNDKIYGLDGHLSFPVLQDLQAVVELWAQYFGCVMSEWSQGAQSSDTRWGFWFNNFKPSRSFFDYQRMYNLCRVYLPIGYGQAAMSHQGSLWMDYDPLTNYPDFCAQNATFEHCDGSEGFINTTFNSAPPITFYLNESTTTGITPAEPLKNACGSHPFAPNQFILKDTMKEIWRNVKRVSNPHLYLLTPERNMFNYGGGSFGQPFDQAYNQGSTYQRWRIEQIINSNNRDFNRDFLFYSGYYDTTFSTRHRWYREAEDDAVDPEHYYHYVWYALDDRMVKDNQDQWMWKNLPIPSTLFGQNVLISRDLLTVWKVTHTTEYRWSSGSQNKQTNTYYYLSKQSYSKGSSTSRFVDLNGVDYGLVQQWRFPYTYFDSLHSAVMDNLGFLPSTDPNSGWGSDTQTHQKSGNYIVYQEYDIQIEPIYFYSLQKDKLTQSVTYPIV